MKKIPKSHSLGRASLHRLEILNVLDLVEKFHHLFSKIGKIKYIDKDLLPVFGNSRIGRKLREHVHDKSIFLRSLSKVTAQNIHGQIMAGKTRELLVGNLFTVWIQDAYRIIDIN